MAQMSLATLVVLLLPLLTKALLELSRSEWRNAADLDAELQQRLLNGEAVVLRRVIDINTLDTSMISELWNRKLDRIHSVDMPGPAFPDIVRSALPEMLAAHEIRLSSIWSGQKGIDIDFSAD